MIAIIILEDFAIRLIPDTLENRGLLIKQDAEVDTSTWSATKELETMLASVHKPEGPLVNCTKVFLFQSEW